MIINREMAHLVVDLMINIKEIMIRIITIVKVLALVGKADMKIMMTTVLHANNGGKEKRDTITCQRITTTTDQRGNNKEGMTIECPDLMGTPMVEMINSTGMAIEAVVCKVVDNSSSLDGTCLAI